MPVCSGQRVAVGVTVLVVICIVLVVGVGLWMKFADVADGDNFPPAPTDPLKLNDYEIELFREYLRIPSVHPNIDYRPCVKYLAKQARSLDLPIKVYYPTNDQNPLVVITWAGSHPDRPSIVLNSHMDVVPVYADQWTHPPFAAEIDSEGKIFGRGSQDTKQLGIQFLAAIRALKLAGIKQLKRTVHVTFAPNEEVGGVYGWQDFVHTDDFRQMNIGFFLDEGLSSEKDGFIALYAERTTFATIFEISGESGHGALPLENTVGEKARYILDRMMNMRDVENNRLKANESLPVGNTTTINLTMMKGGIQINVVPQNVTLAFDVRVAIDVDLIELKKKFEQWGQDVGGGVTVTQKSSFLKPSITRIDEHNIYWMAMKEAAKELNITLIPDICVGRTDAGFVREINIPAIGFSPINKLPLTLHRTDEYITVDMFLQGIDILKAMLTKLANL